MTHADSSRFRPAFFVSVYIFHISISIYAPDPVPLLQSVFFCFDLDFFCFATDFLSFRGLVPGLLQRPFFVLRRGFFYFRAHILSFPGSHSFVFVLFYLLFDALLHLISPLKFFCLNRSLPFVFEVSQTIGCERSSSSALCLANVLHCMFRPSSGFAYAIPLFFAIQDGEQLEVYGEMSSFWGATSRCFRDTVLESDS